MAYKDKISKAKMQVRLIKHKIKMDKHVMSIASTAMPNIHPVCHQQQLQSTMSCAHKV